MNKEFLAHYSEGWYYLPHELCHPSSLILIPWYEKLHYSSIYMCKKDGYVFGECNRAFGKCNRACHRSALYLITRLQDSEFKSIIDNVKKVVSYVSPKLREKLREVVKKHKPLNLW